MVVSAHKVCRDCAKQISVCRSISKSLAFDQSKMQQIKLQQRSDIRFCVRSGLDQKQTIARLQAIYGQVTFSQPTVHRWWTRFHAGEADIQDQPCPGAVLKRTADKVAEVKNFVENDQRTSLREVAHFCDVSKSTAHTIVRKDLGKKKHPAKWVPHNLTQLNKDTHVQKATQALQLFR